MTELRLRKVDAFTDRPFTGNAAAVFVLDKPPLDGWLAAFAREMNLSETAFVIREALPNADFRLRWFTPTMEIDLCGHATLASAHCLLEDGVSSPIRFATRSGVVTVSRQPDGSLSMDFPATSAVAIDVVPGMVEALGAPVEWAGRNDFLVGLLANEVTVRELSPDLAGVARLDATGVIVTAVADPGQVYDFVSRVFAPNAGIPEDPVTGSSHTVLAPYLGRPPRADLHGRPAGVGQIGAGSRAARRPGGRQRSSGDRPGWSLVVERKPKLVALRRLEKTRDGELFRTGPRAKVRRASTKGSQSSVHFDPRCGGFGLADCHMSSAQTTSPT